MINTIVQEKSVKISSKKIKEKEEEEEKEDVSEWWGYEIIYIYTQKDMRKGNITNTRIKTTNK